MKIEIGDILVNYNRDQLLAELRRSIVEVHFNKVSDNSVRVLRCTLNPAMLPSSYKEDVNEQNEENNFHKNNPEIIAAWDLENNGWRSFRMDTVFYAEIRDTGY